MISLILNSFFPGVPLVFQLLFVGTVFVIVFVLVWTFILFLKTWKTRKAGIEPGGEEEINWIFLIPALNEEITIADSINRLKNLKGDAKKTIVVINDGSDDMTKEKVESLMPSMPEIILLNRKAPQARQGKSAALNYAFRYLKDSGTLENDKKTVLCVIDADGRLSPDSLRFVAPYFLKKDSAGVQILVRIYNTSSLLTKAQDIEFAIYGKLFQAGRSSWGTAGMGGNGQFNSAEALEFLAEKNGGAPWRDKLTEDQDLGLQLILNGFMLHHDNRAFVEQQGLNNFRLLLRQRTRWSQGNLQAVSFLPRLLKKKLLVGRTAKAELMVSLLMPFYQALVGISLISALGLWIFGGVDFWSNHGILWFVLIYLLGFSGVMLGCIAAKLGQGFWGVIKAILIAQAYAFYTWILWPVLIRSAGRQLFKRSSWSKTSREKINSSNGL